MYAEAAQVIQRVRLPGLTDSILMNVLYEQAFCLYLKGDFKMAESAIIQFEFQLSKKSFQKDHELLKALLYNEMGKFEESGNIMEGYIVKRYSGQEADSLLSLLSQIYVGENLPKLKKEKTAFVLSFLPGAGLVYAGSFPEGILNFLLSSSALAFGTWQIYTGYYLTGYFTGSVLLEKFYFGGRRRTEYLIEKWNFRESKKFNKKAKGFILSLE